MELLVPTMLLLLGNQSIYQKFFSARTERDARLSVVGWLGGTVLLEVLIVSIAVLGAALFLHTPGVKAREIIPYTARNGVPSLVGAILVGAIFAKVISTANNYLFSPATNLVNDVYLRFVNPGASDRSVLRVSRVLIAVLGLFALLQGSVSESILAMSLYAYTVYSAAITPVVLSAFFWRRATSAGAVVCILAGTAITIFWNVQQLALEAHRDTILPARWLGRDAIFPALLVSVVSLVVVSLLTPAPAPEKWQPFAAAQG
jgi:SSS family solute:Na+ symporter/sodium/proline symporter